MPFYQTKTWRWCLTLLGFLVLAGLEERAVAWCIRSGANAPLAPFILMLNTLGVMGAFLLLGMPGGAAMTALASAGIFTISFLHGVFSYNGVILMVAAAFGACAVLWRRFEAEEMVLKSQCDGLSEEHQVVLLEHERSKGLTESLRKKFQRYADLKKVTEEFASTLSLERIVRILATYALHSFERAARCLIFLVDDESRELGLAFHLEPRVQSPLRSKTGNIFDLWVLKQRKPLLVDDCETDFRFRQEELAPEDRRFRSVMTCPLSSKQSLTGVVRIEAEGCGVFSQDDLRLLDILASLASVAVENSRLYRRTEELAIRDGLTGLFVQRYFKERFAQEHQRALTGKKDLSLLICDLDHFKEYNDRYGHAAGDQVLKQLAQMLSGCLGPGELVARYGGEEFVLLLPDMTKESALKRAEAFRKQIASSRFTIRRQETVMTVSIGVATFPGDALDRETLFAKADQALYRAKREGRNRVCGS
ncbi:MAG: sensor domain-containing diguanylate cyclase [Candidatus Omnitrophica bacterium]|nr:sensor domain-containing diguanylate cyclase [Candidatus Omnitrophota bacterium]